MRLNVAGTDLAFTGAWRGDANQGLVGVDLRGTLGVGWWVEAAYLLGENPHEEISIGIDYSFPILERATVMLQYYRNGAGGTGQGGVMQALQPGERDPFAPFVTGRNYLLAGASLGVLPELSVSAFALQNLDDGTGMAIPTVSWARLASRVFPHSRQSRGCTQTFPTRRPYLSVLSYSTSTSFPATIPERLFRDELLNG